jgi:histidine ammonia-lyase
MGVTAGLKLRQINDNVERILAIELLAAAQGIDFRRQKLGANAKLGRGTRHAYALIRQIAPFLEEDAVLYPYVEQVRRLIADGTLVNAVNHHVADTWRTM